MKWVHGTRFGRDHWSIYQHLCEDHGEDSASLAGMDGSVMYARHDSLHGGMNEAYKRDLPHLQPPPPSPRVIAEQRDRFAAALWEVRSLVEGPDRADMRQAVAATVLRALGAFRGHAQDLAGAEGPPVTGPRDRSRSFFSPDMVDAIKAWRPGGPFPERSRGEMGLNKNGGALDVWVRIEGEPRWIGLVRADLDAFLAGEDEWVTLSVESSYDGGERPPPPPRRWHC